ncbi:uncharacterized protein LOC126314449 [Schistocerca gregaria]|uniref:uncharacterized protein LOC126314449 n=1 Tax=Schistocerca gregaria TaxID=7010 RepID=UPI00211EAA80|nr:uncharacterized protein LOC126314449 [Schistocerca gregaria]
MPILVLNGHERPITHVKFNPEGDLLFTCGKSAKSTVCVWFTDTGELAGTYDGHCGTVWNCDVTYNSQYLATASGDNTARIWSVETGKCLATIKLTAPTRAVNWTLDAKRLLVVTDSFVGTGIDPHISIYDWSRPSDTPQKLASYAITKKQKFSGVKWGRLDKWIYTSDKCGLTIFDAKTGNVIKEVCNVHRKEIKEFNFDKEKGFIITASADGTAKLLNANTLEVVKTYEAGRSVNCAVISPTKNHVLLGGGEGTENVTTSNLDTRQFRTRFFHKIYEHEIGSIGSSATGSKGHFGPLTTLDISQDGSMFASGSEDSNVRLYYLDQDYPDISQD